MSSILLAQWYLTLESISPLDCQARNPHTYVMLLAEEVRAVLIRQMRTVTPHSATDDTIGRWLWALDDSRERTKRLVAGLTLRQLDTVPTGLTNSIGTLLYHIALIEADYLCVDVLGMKEDTLLEELLTLPLDVRDERDRLCVMAGISTASILPGSMPSVPRWWRPTAA